MEMEMVSIVDTSGLPLSPLAPPSSDIVFQTKKSNNEWMFILDVYLI